MEGKSDCWRLGDEELWAVVGRVEACRRADYVRQVEAVAELWSPSAKSKDAQAALVADLMDLSKITRPEAKDLLRHAELFEREAIHDAAREGLLSRRHLVVIDKTLAKRPRSSGTRSRRRCWRMPASSTG
jgi:hypothetical protein